MKMDGFGESGGVDKSGSGKETVFTIENSAHAFRILSESLYSHKVQSVIRELSTNAADEHVAAGRPDDQFDVHLPTVFESWFSIRDYGAGLSEEDATTLYTTFFRSTKRGSNDVTGCLGLGSKSPFAVTDSFTVTSWHGGRETVYTCWKEEGLPRIAKLRESDSTEPSGVMVMFSVDSSFYEWRNEADRVYKFFRVKPRLNIPDDVPMDLGAVRLQGEGWSLHEDEGVSYAVMGNVAYPIDFRAIKTEDPSDAAMCSALARSGGLVFRYPIGAFSFDPSRERLEYTKKTSALIMGSLRSMRAELTSKLSDCVSNAPDELRARRAFVATRQSIFEIFDDTSGTGFCREFADMVPTFGGQELFEGGKLTPKSRRVVTPVPSTYYEKNTRRGKDAVSVGSPASTVYDYDSEDVFFVCDDKKGMHGRMRRRCLETGETCVLMTRQDAVDFARRIGLVGDISQVFSEASALPKAVPGSGSGAPSMRLWGARIDAAGCLTDKVRCTIGDDEAFYLIRTKNGFKLFEGSDRQVDDSQFRDLIRKVRAIGGFVPDEVVTITDSECRRKRLSQRGNLTNLVENLLDQLHDHVRANMGEFCAMVDGSWRCLSDGTTSDLANTLRHARVLAPKLQADHPLARLAEAFRGRETKRLDGRKLTERQKLLRSIVEDTSVTLVELGDLLSEESVFEVTMVCGSESKVDRCSNHFAGAVRTNADELYGMVNMGWANMGCAEAELVSVLRAMHEDPEMPAFVLEEDRKIERLAVRSLVDENFCVESEVSIERAA